VEIRQALPAEFAAVGELTLAAYVGDGHVPAGVDYVEELRDTEGRAATAEIWVAVDAERPVGAVTWCPLGSPLREIARDDEGEFRMLAVSPEVRGRGIGEALVRRCVTRSQEAGFAGVALSSLPTMTAAHRVYERLGFTRDPGSDWSPVPGVVLWAYRTRF
jgi:ribosomal protein S18 acetylase RimI-like enzyme